MQHCMGYMASNFSCPIFAVLHMGLGTDAVRLCTGDYVNAILYSTTCVPYADLDFPTSLNLTSVHTGKAVTILSKKSVYKEPVKSDLA